MGGRQDSGAEPDDSASLLTAALVLTLFGVLSYLEAIGWVVTSALFVLAAGAGIRSWVVRHSRKG